MLPMRGNSSIPLLLSAALTICIPNTAAADQEILSRLREGGLVIAVIASQHGPRTDRYLPPPECPAGSRLTPAGWQDALAIGVGLRKQRVFVELAHAGPGCAARHTAYLVFGADRVRHDPGLAASCTAEESQRRIRRASLVSRLAERAPYPRTNLAVVVDACNLRDLGESTWPECARQPGPGDLVLFDPETPSSVVGCLSLGTLRSWSRRPEQEEDTARGN